MTLSGRQTASTAALHHVNGWPGRSCRPTRSLPRRQNKSRHQTGHGIRQDRRHTGASGTLRHGRAYASQSVLEKGFEQCR